MMEGKKNWDNNENEIRFKCYEMIMMFYVSLMKSDLPENEKIRYIGEPLVVITSSLSASQLAILSKVVMRLSKEYIKLNEDMRDLDKEIKYILNLKN